MFAEPQPVLNPKSESVNRTLILSWEGPQEGTVTGYQVSLYQPSRPDDPDIRILSREKLSISFRNLEADVVYTSKIVTLHGSLLSQEVTLEEKILEACETESELVCPVLRVIDHRL